jgi:hypothetical protein
MQTYANCCHIDQNPCGVLADEHELRKNALATQKQGIPHVAASNSVPTLNSTRLRNAILWVKKRTQKRLRIPMAFGLIWRYDNNCHFRNNVVM